MKKLLAQLLDDIRSAGVIVIGDVMLDEYIIGDSERISPEAPQPIITERERRHVPGGAANVAVNVHALGAKVSLYSIVGDDPEGKLLCSELKKRGVDPSGLLVSKDRPTTRKTRLIARSTQMLRVDRETKDPVSSGDEEILVKAVLSAPEEVIIVSDYAKGVVTYGLMEKLAKNGKRVIVDPKSADFGKYASSYLVTPNLPELYRVTGLHDSTPDFLEKSCRSIMERFDLANILVTLGADGMALIERGKPMNHIHTRAREVYDVTGAGDTVIATLASAVAAGASLGDACHIANIAAGIVVGKHQTAAASPEEIMTCAYGQSVSEKIVDRGTLKRRVEELKKAGMKIVFTNGCFDLLHIGHITYLNEARGLGDVLIVGLNTDRSIRALKGNSRPIIPEEERSHVLAALESVGYVVLFDEDTPLELIRDIRPDVLVKGSDYSRDQVVGHEIVESYGGKVALIQLVDNASTSDIINRIRERY